MTAALPAIFRGLSLLVFGAATAWLIANRLPATAPVVEKAKALAAQVTETPAAVRARNATARALSKGGWSLIGVSTRVAAK